MEVLENTTLNTGDLVVSGTTYTNTVQALAGNLTLNAIDNDSDIIFTVDDAGVDHVAMTIDGGNLAGIDITPLNGGYVDIDDAGTDGKIRLHGNGTVKP